MKKLLLCIPLLLMLQSAVAQELTITPEGRERYEEGCMGNEDCIRAKMLQYSGKAYDAMQYYWPLLEQAEQTKDWPMYILCASNLVFMYGGGEDYQKGLDLAEEALEKIKKEAPQHLKDCFWIYNSMTGIYYRRLDQKRVHETNIRALNLLQENYPENYHLFIRGYNNVGGSYAMLGDLDKAYHYYMKAKAVCEAQEHPDNTELSITYGKLSSYYYEIGNFELSIEYLEKCIEKTTELYGPNDYHLIYNILDLGHHYEVLQEYPQAFEYYEKAYYIDQNVQSGANEEYRFEITLHIHFSLASLCLQTQRLEEAYQYYQKVLKLIDGRKEKWFDRIVAITGMAKVEYQSQDLEAALSTFQQAGHLLTTRLASGSYGDNIDRINAASDNIYLGFMNCYEQNGQDDRALYYAKLLLEEKQWDRVAWDQSAILLSLAELYRHQNRIDSALYYNQAAVNALSSSSLDTLPLAEEMLNVPLAYRALYQRAQLALLSDGPDTGQKMAQSLRVIDLIDELHSKSIKKINLLRRGQSKSLVDQATAPYHLGINIADQHYRCTGSPEAMERAFYYAQKMKAQQLWLSLLKEEARQYSHIDTALLEVERDLQAEITFYEKKLIEARQNEDTAMVHFYQKDKLFQLNSDYSRLQRQLEKDYPDYYASKYDFTPETAASLREVLHEEELLIEYVLADSLLYIFTLSEGQSLQLTATALHPETAAQVNRLNQYLRNSPMFRKSSREKFIGLSHDLYRQFLQPVKAQIQGKKRLVIIGNGITNYLPFETLLASPEVRPFHELHFLVEEVEVSYHYSSSLFAKARRRVVDSLSGLFAFAPVYEYENATVAVLAGQSKTTFRAIRADGSFEPLPESEQEVETIAQLYGHQRQQEAKVALREGATERSLKTELEKPYRFIHIAGHSFADLDHPKFSGIACFHKDSGQQDSLSPAEDGILHSGEIYNIPTAADLVTLSSCESGYGRLDKTEGLLGLNRAFIYSGAQNVVFSLWKVYDKVSAQLMVDFYQGILEEGQSYSSSLRRAKLKQISNPATASPHYWGAYLLIGR